MNNEQHVDQSAHHTATCREALQELYDYCKDNRFLKDFVRGQHLIKRAGEALSAGNRDILQGDYIHTVKSTGRRY